MQGKDVDGRVKPGHDQERCVSKDDATELL
jgi:hypothetical protein